MNCGSGALAHRPHDKPGTQRAPAAAREKGKDQSLRGRHRARTLQTLPHATQHRSRCVVSMGKMEEVRKTQRELRKKQRLVLKRRKCLVKVAFLLLRAALATSNWAFPCYGCRQPSDCQWRTWENFPQLQKKRGIKLKSFALASFLMHPPGWRRKTTRSRTSPSLE